MKTINLMLAIIIGIAAYSPCFGQVPDNVLRSFKQQYPQANIEDGSVRNDTCMVAFFMPGSMNRAYYLTDGQWVKTETGIRRTRDLPMAVDMGWKYSDFASWDVAGIKEVQYPGRELFVMKVQHDCGPDGSIPGDCLDVYKLYFDPDGELIKKVHSGDE